MLNGMGPILGLLLLALSVVRADDELFEFVTRPDIGAPKWTIHNRDADALQQGQYWFTSPYSRLEQDELPLWNGPHIYDTTGELIWSGVEMGEHMNVYDFRAAEIDGEQYLTYVWGKNNRIGNGYILDNSYNIHRIVDMDRDPEDTKDKRFNLHEWNLIQNGTRALVITNPRTDPTDLDYPEYKGPCKVNWQGFKEIEVGRNGTHFAWESQEHIDPRESTFIPDSVAANSTTVWKDKCAQPWDFTHFNSVEKLDDDDYMVSARHTDTIYKISHMDKSIVWRLGGPQNDFEFLDRRARFSRQHDARYQGRNETHIFISVFDNAVGRGRFEEETSWTSWGLLLALNTDVKPPTVGLVSRYIKPKFEEAFGDKRPFTDARGNMMYLENGNAFVGWAIRNQISEHSADGEILMTAMLNVERLKTYRTYKMPWTGRPSKPPDVVANAVGTNTTTLTLNTTVWISWNGATDVETWEVLRSDREGNMTSHLIETSRTGFETNVTFDGLAEYIIAVARDIDGIALGQSNIIAVNVSKEYGAELYASERKWRDSLLNATKPELGKEVEDETTVTVRPATTTVPLKLIGFCGGLFMLICTWIGVRYYKRRGVRLRQFFSRRQEIDPAEEEHMLRRYSDGDEDEDEEKWEEESDESVVSRRAPTIYITSG